jgi:general secretion pathway protein K
MSRAPVAAQRGASLILALLIVALVTVLAAALVEGQDRWYRQVKLEGDRRQAMALAEAAIDYGRAVLADDERRGNIDHRGEAWARPLPPMNVEGGLIHGSVEDLQGRLNLNAVLTDRAPLEAFWAAQGWSREQLDALADYIDADSDTRFPGGAEDQYYLGMARPARAANEPLVTLEDLLAVRGFGPEAVARLGAVAAIIAAYPATAPLNVNVASSEALMATIPGLDRAQADRLRRLVDLEPLRSAGDLEAALRDGGWRGGVLPTLAFTSRYFLIRGEVRWGEASVRMQVAVERMGAGAVPRILWKRLEAGE